MSYKKFITTKRLKCNKTIVIIKTEDLTFFREELAMIDKA
jgi:hypothetical protein